jgi:hypothetical protein
MCVQSLLRGCSGACATPSLGITCCLGYVQDVLVCECWCWCGRYDYESVETDKADAVMVHLAAQIDAFAAAKAADSAHGACACDTNYAATCLVWWRGCIIVMTSRSACEPLQVLFLGVLAVCSDFGRAVHTVGLRLLHVCGSRRWECVRQPGSAILIFGWIPHRVPTLWNGMTVLILYFKSHIYTQINFSHIYAVIHAYCMLIHFNHGVRTGTYACTVSCAVRAYYFAYTGLRRRHNPRVHGEVRRGCDTTGFTDRGGCALCTPLSVLQLTFLMLAVKCGM